MVLGDFSAHNRSFKLARHRETSVSGPASTNPHQFTGRENDATGLYYYRARYYHPTLQRFIAEDPIGFLGGDVNLYAYVRNAPLVLLDPLGLDVWNTSTQPWLVKPERGLSGILPPGHWAPISPDGVRPPGGAVDEDARKVVAASERCGDPSPRTTSLHLRPL